MSKIVVDASVGVEDVRWVSVTESIVVGNYPNEGIGAISRINSIKCGYERVSSDSGSS